VELSIHFIYFEVIVEITSSFTLLLLNLAKIKVAVLDYENFFYIKKDLKLIIRALPHYARFACDDSKSTF
jgi:hypothetical protein